MKLLLALSGGADSVALLLHLLEQKTPFEAAHCNFHLRANESDCDEAFVRRLCKERGVCLHVKHFDTQKEAKAAGESIEQAARRLRYAWFATLCKERRMDAVAVAHHRNDNAETLLLNLVRGAGLRGLSAMRVENKHAEGGCRVVRPLLDWSRSEIERFLAERGQDYVTDSTNADTAYRRNFIRHRLMPLLSELNPSIVEALHATARRLSDSLLLSDYAVAVLQKEICRPLPDGLRIDKEKLLAAPAPAALLYEFLRPYAFRSEAAAALLAMRTGGFVENALCVAAGCVGKSAENEKTDGLGVMPGSVKKPNSCTKNTDNGEKKPFGRAAGNLCRAESYIATATHDAIEVRRYPVPLNSDFFLPDADGEIRLPNGARFIVSYQTLADDEQPLDYISRSGHIAVLDADRLVPPLHVTTPKAGTRFSPLGLRGTQTVTHFLTARRCSRIDKLAALVVADALGVAWLVNERPDNRAALTPTTKSIVKIVYQSAGNA